MTDRSTNPSTALGCRFATRLRLARAALLWEAGWPACWPALGVLGLFLVLALFDLLPLLPGALHAAVLLAFGAGFLFALATAFRFIAPPTVAAARRRIERASGLLHRPLQALSDRPSSLPDPQAAKLWDAHQQRMEVLVRRLRIGPPVAGLTARDPWGLRAVLAMLLLIGAVDAGGDWDGRLLRAVTPSVEGAPPALAASLDIWITPPEYTGLPPQFLRPENQQTIPVPIGSTLLAQVHGGGSVPRLAVDQTARDFAATDKEDFQVQLTLSAGKRIEVSQAGTVLGSWPIRIIPDHPPSIVFAKPPEATAHQALRIEYQASDDYGVERIKAVIRRQTGGDGSKIEIEVPLPGLHLKQAQATSFHDLTPHPWAGLPVEIRLVATDGLGQTGESTPVRIKLPERVFTNPIARAIIEQRRELAADPRSRRPVAEILGDLRSRPRLYRDDMVVFLALRIAQERLQLHDDAAAIEQVEQLLWDTALRIEDGQASLAQNKLRRLQQQLQDALAKNAPEREIERLMTQLKQALDRYLQALAQNMARNPGQREPPADPSRRVVTSRDLERMLDRAEELARNGARDQARELLSQLQNMLENLRMGRPGQPQESSKAQQMMRGMRDLMNRQQQLLDRSFRAQQQFEQGQMGIPGDQDRTQPNGAGDLPGAAQQQEALRHVLGDMMRRMGDELGKIPNPLGRAERAMHDAARALNGGQPGAAIGPQTDALDQLQQAAREFDQQMQQRLGTAWGEPTDRGDGTGQPREGGERDPLGRPMANGGAYDQGDVKIPDQGMMQRSRQILDELRRRAGEHYRPQIELDYIDRLMQRF
jgi:uncharacterized protein (TIGR02302 family)